MYQVDLHAHTIASTHAYSTVNEYFSEAARRGIKLFAITDHALKWTMLHISGILPICLFCHVL
ncbi:Probable phosphatase YcdX [Providencia stuartii]|nr:Probable phosphatase YcdX [Providencia stuartii]